jgi:hydroxyacylglutathione hydrolase
MDPRLGVGQAQPRPGDQVHRDDEHTVILRQNMAVHYEAPLLYLLLGNDRALLVDSGATPQPEFFPLRATVERLLSGWLARHRRDHYRLLVWTGCWPSRRAIPSPTCSLGTSR